MFENLRKLYRHYGGIRVLLSSSYLWISFVLAVLSYQSIPNYRWADKALSVMPSLMGFTIAAFAIVFAIFGPENLKKLLAATSDNGRSPVVGIATSIGHAILIQVFAIIIAILSKLANVDLVIDTIADWVFYHGYSPSMLLRATDWVATIFSAMGLFFMYYGVMLVLAAVLTMFRIQLIVADAAKPKLQRRQKQND